MDLVADPRQRGALVPVDIGSQLDHFAAARHPQSMSLPVSVRCRDDLGHAVRRDIAKVDRDGIALVFDVRSRDVLRASSRSSAAALSRTGTAAAAASL